MLCRAYSSYVLHHAITASARRATKQVFVVAKVQQRCHVLQNQNFCNCIKALIRSAAADKHLQESEKQWWNESWSGTVKRERKREISKVPEQSLWWRILKSKINSLITVAAVHSHWFPPYQDKRSGLGIKFQQKRSETVGDLGLKCRPTESS